MDLTPQIMPGSPAPQVASPPTLRQERLGDLIVIYLPAATCLYAANASALNAGLADLAEDFHRANARKARGVLLLQDGDAHDWHAAWLHELTSASLFNDLVSRMDTWRWLLSLIRNSPVPWVYAAAGDAQGSAWELALSCQRRFWYRGRAQLGFPEVLNGAFPPGGVLESLNKRAGRTRERWQLKPVFTASEALADRLIDFCSDAAAWTEQAKSMAQQLIRVDPSSGVRELRRRRQRDDFAAVDEQSRRAAYEQLESVWRHDRVGGISGPTAWEYCWQLVKERAKLKQSGDLGRLICLISTRYLLSPAYATWLQAKLVVHAGIPRWSWSGTQACLPPLIIDLEACAPPTAILCRLLQAPAQIVFAASDNHDLVNSLNLIYGRLERTLGGGPAQAAWERSVMWYQGGCDQGPNPVLRWQVDGTFHLSAQGREASFVRLEGNGSQAKPGYMEWATAPEQNAAANLAPTITGSSAAISLSPLMQTILMHVADGLLHVHLAAYQLPLTVQLRTLFIEEMLAVSRPIEGDLTTIVESLKLSGWQFAGDEDAWDHFLRARHDLPQLEASQENGLTKLLGQVVGRNLAGPGLRDVASWKQAKLVAKRNSLTADARWNATAISQHFALWLGVLAGLVWRSGAASDPSSADCLCGLALGLPPSYGTPQTFLHQRGRRQVEHYAAVHWPRLQLAGSVYQQDKLELGS